MDEYLDRERRKMNLVIYGLPEHQGSISTECQSKDSDSLRELVHSEFSVDNLEINKIICLGRFFKTTFGDFVR